MQEKKLAQLIRPAGFYNIKAKRLGNLIKYIMLNYDGDLDKMFAKDLHTLRKELLSVNGVGKETADSILLYAGHKPIFVIDAYTKRIFSRIGMCKDKCEYDELQKIFHKSLPKSPRLFNEYHALIVELAKQNCTKKPSCKDCPINKLCKRFI